MEKRHKRQRCHRSSRDPLRDSRRNGNASRLTGQHDTGVRAMHLECRSQVRKRPNRLRQRLRHMACMVTDLQSSLQSVLHRWRNESASHHTQRPDRSETDTQVQHEVYQAIHRRKRADQRSNPTKLRDLKCNDVNLPKLGICT